MTYLLRRFSTFLIALVIVTAAFTPLGFWPDVLKWAGRWVAAAWKAAAR